MISEISASIPDTNTEPILLLNKKLPLHFIEIFNLLHSYNELKLNLWLKTPKGATPVNWTSATDWQIVVRPSPLHFNFTFSYSVDHIIQLLNFITSACLTTDHEVAGLIPGTSTNFKCGLGLERGPPSLVRTTG